MVRDVKVESSLNCSDLELVDFRIVVREGRVKNKIATLNLKRTDSSLFKDALKNVV